eukprot:Skav229436  [mRNA]  locus=scaffold397:78072:82470:+ [translate_table: standard]
MRDKKFTVSVTTSSCNRLPFCNGALPIGSAAKAASSRTGEVARSKSWGPGSSAQKQRAAARSLAQRACETPWSAT